MKKQIEPQSLTDWKQQSNDNWQPSYSGLGSSLKDDIKKSLIKEQGYLCCYCEQRLPLPTSELPTSH